MQTILAATITVHQFINEPTYRPSVPLRDLGHFLLCVVFAVFVGDPGELLYIMHSGAAFQATGLAVTTTNDHEETEHNEDRNGHTKADSKFFTLRQSTAPGRTKKALHAGRKVVDRHKGVGVSTSRTIHGTEVVTRIVDTPAGSNLDLVTSAGRPVWRVCLGLFAIRCAVRAPLVATTIEGVSYGTFGLLGTGLDGSKGVTGAITCATGTHSVRHTLAGGNVPHVATATVGSEASRRSRITGAAAIPRQSTERRLCRRRALARHSKLERHGE